MKSRFTLIELLVEHAVTARRDASGARCPCRSFRYCKYII